jgi:hypothetical protein
MITVPIRLGSKKLGAPVRHLQEGSVFIGPEHRGSGLIIPHYLSARVSLTGSQSSESLASHICSYTGLRSSRGSAKSLTVSSCMLAWEQRKTDMSSASMYRAGSSRVRCRTSLIASSLWCTLRCFGSVRYFYVADNHTIQDGFPLASCLGRTFGSPSVAPCSQAVKVVCRGWYKRLVGT